MKKQILIFLLMVAMGATSINLTAQNLPNWINEVDLKTDTRWNNDTIVWVDPDSIFLLRSFLYAVQQGNIETASKLVPRVFGKDVEFGLQGPISEVDPIKDYIPYLKSTRMKHSPAVDSLFNSPNADKIYIVDGKFRDLRVNDGRRILSQPYNQAYLSSGNKMYFPKSGYRWADFRNLLIHAPIFYRAYDLKIMIQKAEEAEQLNHYQLMLDGMIWQGWNQQTDETKRLQRRFLLKKIEGIDIFVDPYSDNSIKNVSSTHFHLILTIDSRKMLLTNYKEGVGMTFDTLTGGFHMVDEEVYHLNKEFYEWILGKAVSFPEVMTRYMREVDKK